MRINKPYTTTSKCCIIILQPTNSKGIYLYLRAHADREAFARALSSGDLLRASGDRLRIPESSFFVSDSIISELV